VWNLDCCMNVRSDDERHKSNSTPAPSGRYKVIVGLITWPQNCDCCIAITTTKTAVTSLQDKLFQIPCSTHSLPLLRQIFYICYINIHIFFWFGLRLWVLSVRALYVMQVASANIFIFFGWVYTLFNNHQRKKRRH
jgi:hypothetical protein